MLELSDEALARLNAEANRRGVTLDELVAELAANLPARTLADGRLSFVGIGYSTSGRSAAEADEMLAEGFGRD